MSIETIRTIRDGEPRTATLTFTHLLGSHQLSVNKMLDQQIDRLFLCIA